MFEEYGHAQTMDLLIFLYTDKSAALRESIITISFCTVELAVSLSPCI